MTRRRMLATAAAALAAVALTFSLSACTSTDAATQAFRDGQNAGYIGGDGRWVEVPEAERDKPVDFAGVTQDGDEVSGADLRGNVVVINFWYAACGPCRVEAPDLEKVYQDHKDNGVSFIGINTADQADTAKSFMKTYGVTYPSIIDAGDGAAKIAFAQTVPLQASPNTVVLDKEGRVAARIIGAIDGPSVLNTFVTELSEES